MSYKTYLVKQDYTYTYKNLYGEERETKVTAGSHVYEGINYDQNFREHYFTKKAGNGGEYAGLVRFIENTPEIFELV